MAKSPRHQAALILLSIILGSTLFFAGRFSVPVKIVTETISPPAADVPVVLEKPVVPKIISPPVEQEASSAASGWQENVWQRLSAHPRTPASITALAAMLEKLAAANPAQALSLAQAEGNLLVRDQFIQATLHGWARLSTTNAANWALALPDPAARETALASVFAGAIAANPDDAVRAGKFILQQNPDEAAGLGARLIDALCDAGNFEAAAKFSAGGDAAQRTGWMAEAYCKWAQLQPAEAAQAATAMDDPDLRNQALHGIVGGWAAADPVALVQFVTQLPAENSQRGSLISQALDRWARTDPETASKWINNHDVGPELDQGVAAIATTEGVRPELGVNWADSITDPKLRSETLNLVIRNWLNVDAAAARQFFDNTKNLSPDERRQLAEIFYGSGHDSAQR